MASTAAAPKTVRPSLISLGDPLAPTTRKERRNLLGSSAVVVTIVKTGLVPSKVAALGVEFSSADRSRLVHVAAAIVAYFVCAFLVYAGSDFICWRINYRDAKVEWSKLFNPKIPHEELRAFPLPASFRIFSRPTALLRGIFEFLLPVLLGLYAIACAMRFQ